jgi:glycerol kinase
VLFELAPGRRSFCLEGTVITAGAAIEWLVELGLLADATRLDALMAATPTANGVTFVPALQGLGAPFLDTQARAALLGLTRGVRAEHVVRAVLEGVAERCADVVESLPLAPGALAVDGGLARCDAFVALLADRTGRALSRAAESETTALGAAYLAGLAVGVWSDPAAALATAPPPTEVPVRMEAAEREELRASWRRALARVRDGNP